MSGNFSLVSVNCQFTTNDVLLPNILWTEQNMERWSKVHFSSAPKVCVGFEKMFQLEAAGILVEKDVFRMTQYTSSTFKNI